WAARAAERLWPLAIANIRAGVMSLELCVMRVPSRSSGMCRLSTAARPSFRSISRRINTPPFDDSLRPSNVAVIVFPPTGDRPGRNSRGYALVPGDSHHLLMNPFEHQWPECHAPAPHSLGVGHLGCAHAGEVPVHEVGAHFAL